MGIRQTLNEKPGLTTGLTAAVIVLAISFILWQAFGGRHSSSRGMPGKVFFSDDDGTSYFADDASKVPPFDHNGKPAYRAIVYQCGDGKPFVGHLERFSDEDKAKMEEQIKQNPKAGPAIQYMGFGSAMEVKKPGEANWIKFSPLTQQQFGAVMKPVCPDGSSNDIRPVRPGAEDAKE